MLRGVVLAACAAAARAATDLRVTFSASAGNVTVCDAPTEVFEAATIPLAAWQLANGSVAQVGGYYTQNEPNVSWTVDDNDETALFSLFMLDPDAFYCGKGVKIHWSILNIPGDDIPNGDAVNPFAHPGPPEMRYHRYVFLLHKQAAVIDLSDDEKASLQQRTFFDYPAFCDTHALGSPVAQVAIEAQLDAFVVEYYMQSGVDLCSYPSSCSLVA